MDLRLLEEFNKEINREFNSAYLYFAMSTYFDEIAMTGFNDFMRDRAAKKLQNAHKIYDYLILRDEKLTFSKIDEPDNDWLNVSDVFSMALSHEEYILVQLNELFRIAQEVQDFAAMEFCANLISEQVKATGQIRKLVFRVKNSNVVSTSVELLDNLIKQSFCKTLK